MCGNPQREKDVPAFPRIVGAKTQSPASHPGSSHHTTNSLTPESPRGREGRVKDPTSLHRERKRPEETGPQARGSHLTTSHLSAPRPSKPALRLPKPHLPRPESPGWEHCHPRKTDSGSPGRGLGRQGPDTCRGPHPTPEGYQPPPHMGESRQAGAEWRQAWVWPPREDLPAPVDRGPSLASPRPASLTPSLRLGLGRGWRAKRNS